VGKNPLRVFETAETAVYVENRGFTCLNITQNL
jgi:hypothetical protein